jgi:PAS domain S-box-containing protein
MMVLRDGIASAAHPRQKHNSGVEWDPARGRTACSFGHSVVFGALTHQSAFGAQNVLMTKDLDLNNGTTPSGKDAAGHEPQLTNGLGPEQPGAADLYAGATEYRFSETRRLLQTLLDNSPDMIYFKDRESRFVHYSKSFSRFFRLESPDSLKGKSDADIFAEEHARPAYEDEQQIIRTGAPIVGKLEKEVHQDGRITWALTSKMPWRNEDGQTLGIFGISKDVTALKEVEQKLAYERELLRALLDNAPDCIYFKDLQSRFVQVSKSKTEKSLRHSAALRKGAQVNDESEIPQAAATHPELLIGLTDFDLFAEENARCALEEEQEIIRTGKPLVDKLEKQLHLDGTSTWSLVTKMPWRAENGQIIGTFGMSRDITELKRAEAELAIAHKRLVEASRLAGMAEVATDVLHNVGNTLNSINVACAVITARVEERDVSNLARVPEMIRENTGQLELFLTSDSKGKCIPEYLAVTAETLEEDKQFLLSELRQLRKNIEHVNQIVAMQQSYAKVAGLEESVEIPQLVDDAIQINAAALNRHEIRLETQVTPVPRLLLDKHKVLQILVNLVSNAKYALSGSERHDKRLTIRVFPTATEGVAIEVRDNGVGIRPEHLTRIFAHGFTTRRSGHGFGLHSGAIAAKELGGSLTVHSDGPGRGAVFTLTLPLRPVRKGP